MIVGVFNAFPDSPDAMGSLERQALGGVLAWIALAAFAATVAGGFAQLMRWRYRDDSAGRVHRYGPVLCMAVPALCGLVAVSYCVRWGAAVLSEPPLAPGFWPALAELLGRLF